MNKKIKIYKPKSIVFPAYIITFILFFIGILINPFYFEKKYLYTLIVSAMLGILAHEALHYTTAKITKVDGIGFHFTVHGIVLKYKQMSRFQCIFTSISPFLFFFFLMILSKALEYDLGMHIFVLSWVAFSSSGFDVLSFLIFLFAGGKRTYPIYDENGKIAGGIVENDNIYVLLVKNIERSYVERHIKNI